MKTSNGRGHQVKKAESMLEHIKNQLDLQLEEIADLHSQLEERQEQVMGYLKREKIIKEYLLQLN